MGLYLGLMSGTSMDGIDAALLDTATHTLIDAMTVPYPDALQNELLQFDATQKYTLQTILTLHQKVGQAFATAALTLLKKMGYSSEKITAIWSHGQTVYHAPELEFPTTLQLGCAHTIAEKTGITVVSDFRTRDLILGGQGAPLAPYYHYQLIKKENLPAIVVNLGGIANISFLKKDTPPIGYDVGPGNVLMDAWIKKHHNAAFDKNGDWAATGKVIPVLLEALLADTFFLKSPPKSIDKAYYALDWLEPHLKKTDLPQDVQATLLYLTAVCIARAIQMFSSEEIGPVYLCGGGAHNHALRQILSRCLPEYVIKTTDDFQVSPDYLEAMMMAWLAEQALNNRALDLRQITGASKPAILGVIYPTHCMRS